MVLLHMAMCKDTYVRIAAAFHYAEVFEERRQVLRFKVERATLSDVQA